MPKKILIMDDEEDLCKEVKHFLEEQGYEVSYALDGKRGMVSIKRDLPNLLLLDIRMPRMNGLEVLKQLTESYPNLVVVVVSGFLDPETMAKVVECGAALSVDKPFKLEDLHQRVIIPLIGPGREF